MDAALFLHRMDLHSILAPLVAAYVDLPALAVIESDPQMYSAWFSIKIHLLLNATVFCPSYMTV